MRMNLISDEIILNGYSCKYAFNGEFSHFQKKEKEYFLEDEEKELPHILKKLVKRYFQLEEKLSKLQSKLYSDKPF